MSLDTNRLRNPAIKDWANEHLNLLSRMVYFGAPLLADVDKIVTSTDMKVGAYTVAAQPDIARNITVTVTAVDTADTMGTITVVGTNINGKVISEVITPVADSTVAGVKAFKTVTSVTGAGWVIDAVEASNDTITVGIGTVLGLPILISSAAEVLLGALGVALIAPTVVADSNEIEKCTVDISSGTYDGSKKAFCWVVE